MAYKGENLEERFLIFSLGVIDLLDKLPRNFIINSISSQLIRSATSIGANWEEAMGGLSKADFIHSANIAKKEARETLYWFKILKAVLKTSDAVVPKLMEENLEIIKVLTSIVKKSQFSGTAPAKKMVLFLFFIICSLSLIPYPLSLHAAKIYPSAGSTSAVFLKIPVGSRASAMGGAFTSVSDDIYASFYNPAGLAYLPEKTLSFMHNDYFSNLSQVYLVYGLKGEDIDFLGRYKALRKGSWAFSLNYFFTQKDLERRSGLYESDPLYPISPVEGKFRAWDLSAGLHYGYNYDAYTAVGGSLKFITQNIDSESGSSFALDLGIMKKFEFSDRVFSGAFTIQNLGPGIKFSSRRYDLPLLFKAGISHRAIETDTLFSFDAEKYIDNYPYLVLGAEHYLSDKLFLRAGYRYRINGNELGAWSGFNAGIGFIYDRFAFDYSFTPYGDLGYSHKITLSFKFISKKPPEIIPARQMVKAEDKIKEIKGYSYSVYARQLKLTPYYSEYEINGENGENPVSEISFKTRARGSAPVSLSVLSGSLPEYLAGKTGLKNIFTAFQISYDGMMLSSVDMRLKIERSTFDVSASKKEDLIFLYMDKKGFREAALKLEKEDETSFYYSVKVPQSTHYVLGTR